MPFTLPYSNPISHEYSSSVAPQPRQPSCRPALHATALQIYVGGNFHAGAANGAADAIHLQIMLAESGLAGEGLALLERTNHV